jgi:hypothetical protein
LRTPFLGRHAHLRLEGDRVKSAARIMTATLILGISLGGAAFV